MWPYLLPLINEAIMRGHKIIVCFYGELAEKSENNHLQITLSRIMVTF